MLCTRLSRTITAACFLAAVVGGAFASDPATPGTSKKARFYAAKRAAGRSSLNPQRNPTAAANVTLDNG